MELGKKIVDALSFYTFAVSLVVACDQCGERIQDGDRKFTQNRFDLKWVKNDESCVSDGETAEVKGVSLSLEHVYGVYIHNYFHPSP